MSTRRKYERQYLASGMLSKLCKEVAWKGKQIDAKFVGLGPNLGTELHAIYTTPSVRKVF